MKRQQKVKGIVLIVFVLYFAGLLLYWANKNDSFWTVGSCAGAVGYDVKPDHSFIGQGRVASLDRDRAEMAPSQGDHAIGRSSSFTELAQEIRAQSHDDDESELFLPIANLATGHPNAQVREEGIAYLAQSEDERAVVFLITALMDTELHIRQLSLNALYRFGKRVPVQPLIEFALNDGGAMRAQVVALIRQVAGAGSDEVMQLEAQLQE